MKNKLLSIIFLIITLFSIIQPVFAIENTGTQKWVAAQFDSGIYTTDKPRLVGRLIRKLSGYNKTEYITTFCSQYGVASKTGAIELATHSVPTDELLQEACKVAYLGWYSKYGDYVVDGGILAADMIWVKEDYIFTQQYIWELLGQNSDTFIDADVQNRYYIFRENIEQKLANMEKRPSFSNETITLDTGTTTTLTDSNGVLKDYASIDKTVNGIRLLHNYGENTINVTIDEKCNLESYKFTEEEMESYGLIKEETKNHNTTVYIDFRENVQDQIYAMNYNFPVSMSLNLKINTFGNLELTKLNTEGNLIDGAVFEVNGPNNFFKEVNVTNGKITIDNLKKGTYTIKEKTAPSGYLLNTETYTVEVFPNQTTTQAIVNKDPTGTFTLVKKNAERIAAIEGAKYRIWNNNGYDKQFTTDKQGKITVTGLELGTYNYQEIQAPTGYLIDTNTYTFEVKYKDQNTSVIYVNTEKTNEEPIGQISIIKKDSETGDIPQGDATFLNAKYEVYADEDIYDKAKTKKFYSKGDLVATRIMNKGGMTEIIENLPLGRYKIKEILSSEGYLVDPKEYQINLEYQNQKTKIISKTVTSYEQVKKMQVHIFKSGIRENSGLVAGLKDAEFTIKLSSDVERAYQKGYSYEEIWNGIHANKNRVAEAQKIAPTYEKITTDQNGNAYTQEKLPYGKYIVKETVTPKGFETATDFTFSITQDESEIKEVAQKVKHLVVNNEQFETYIKLIKKDLKTDKIVTLSSSTFEIKAKQDIYDKGTGKIIYKKGETIRQKVGNTTYSTFTTNADNIVVPQGSYNNPNEDKGTVTTPLTLPVGSYEITEVKSPEGFLQLGQSINFKVEGINNYDKDQDYIQEVIIKNEQPTGTLILKKTIKLREDVDTSLINISDFCEISFKLMAKEDIINFADGSIIYEKGKEIGTYNLDKNGNLKIENLPMGIYEIQEVQTLDGLILDYTKYEVKFIAKDNVTKVYEIKQEIENKTTIVEFAKQDITGEEVLVGAKLTILDENGEIIDTWISKEENHKIEGLVVGKNYILREEQAPEGYTLAEDIKFTVCVDKEKQVVVMKDEPIVQEVLVIQTGNPINNSFVLILMIVSIIGIIILSRFLSNDFC